MPVASSFPVLDDMVEKYSVKKDGEKSLSKNFKVKEFRCKDGSDTVLIDTELVKLLQKIRDYFGKSIRINSAYRNATYNKKVGGASGSQHVKGTAADIVVEGLDPKVVAGFCDVNNPKGGVGWYSTFVHVDSRGNKSRWLGSSPNKGISGFGLGDNYSRYKEEVVTQQDFDKMMEDWLERKKSKSVSSWASAELQEAMQKGITDGSSPQSFVTREQAAIMALRSTKI